MKKPTRSQLVTSKLEKHFDFITPDYKVDTITMWPYNFTDSDISYMANLFKRTAAKKSYDINVEGIFEFSSKQWRKNHSACHFLHEIGYFDYKLTRNSAGELCKRYSLSEIGGSIFESIKLSLSIENTENPTNTLVM